MIRSAQLYFSSLPSVFLDGLIYVLIAIFGFNQSVLSSDEAIKFIAPWLLFMLKWLNGGAAAGLLAMKLFRSTAFAEHQQKKEAERKGSFETTQMTRTTRTDLTTPTEGTTVAQTEVKIDLTPK